MGGTLPMLIYYGVKFINPTLIYAASFVVTCIFSLLTGTAWGSAATIGVVMLSIGVTLDANTAIIAGAVVSGAFFGDKLSPLSDSTNIAAIAAKVSLYDHVRSMMWTTTPASIIALICYVIFGFVFPAGNTSLDAASIQNALGTLSSAFHFTPLSLIPLVIVLYGSFKQKPPVPVMLIGAMSGFGIGMLTQGFSFENTMKSIVNGFNTEMITLTTVGENAEILTYLERGGLWTLSGLVTTVMLILTFISILTSIGAVNAVVERVFKNINTRFKLVTSTLTAGTFLIMLTSNGVGTSFILGDVFGPIYDKLNVSRKVLSRSCEDSGTMVDPLLPWSPSGVFMAGTLGVATVEYLPFAIVNYITIVIAVIFAYFGIGCFLKEQEKKKADAK